MSSIGRWPKVSLNPDGGKLLWDQNLLAQYRPVVADDEERPDAVNQLEAESVVVVHARLPPILSGLNSLEVGGRVNGSAAMWSICRLAVFRATGFGPSLTGTARCIPGDHMLEQPLPNTTVSAGMTRPGEISLHHPSGQQ